MDNNQEDLKQSIKGLRGSAKGIAAAMDDEGITSEEVYCLLLTIADRMDYLSDKSINSQLSTST